MGRLFEWEVIVCYKSNEQWYVSIVYSMRCFLIALNFGAWSLCAHNDYVNSNNVPFSQVHVFLSPLKLLYLVWNTHLDLSQVRGLCKGPLAPFGNATTDEWSEWLDAGEIVQIDQIFVLTNSLCGQKTSDKLYKPIGQTWDSYLCIFGEAQPRLICLICIEGMDYRHII